MIALRRLIAAEGDYRINVRNPPNRKPGGEAYRRQHQPDDAAIGPDVEGVYSEEQAAETTRHEEGRQHSEADSYSGPPVGAERRRATAQ